jgi:hypothetical protein
VWRLRAQDSHACPTPTHLDEQLLREGLVDGRRLDGELLQAVDVVALLGDLGLVCTRDGRSDLVEDQAPPYPTTATTAPPPHLVGRGLVDGEQVQRPAVALVDEELVADAGEDDVPAGGGVHGERFGGCAVRRNRACPLLIAAPHVDQPIKTHRPTPLPPPCAHLYTLLLAHMSADRTPSVANTRPAPSAASLRMTGSSLVVTLRKMRWGGRWIVWVGLGFAVIYHPAAVPLLDISACLNTTHTLHTHTQPLHPPACAPAAAPCAP